MARHLELTPAIVSEALLQSAGVVAHAADKLRVTPQTVRRYIRMFQECQEAKYEARESNCDLAETKLLQNIKAGKEASVFFYLKTMGKERGFVERSEHTGKGGAALMPATIDPAKLSTQALRELRNATVNQDAADAE